MTNSILANKKIWVVGVIAVVVVLIAFGISSARATIMEHQMMYYNYSHMPQINGSINISHATKNFVDDHLKISFLQASEIADKQIENGTITGGYLGIVQGYLTYTFYVIDSGSKTGHMVLLDAGNGKVLYISTGLPMFEQFGPWSSMWQQHPWGTGQW